MKNELFDSQDSLLSVLFSCFLAVALSSVRERPNRFNPPVSSLGLPQEMEYADDVNFLVEENKPLDHLLYVAAEKLKVHNMLVN